MDEVLSHDLGHIVADFDHDDSDGDREEEEIRQREIQGLLDEHFDSISTVDGEEDDDDDLEDQERIYESENDKVTIRPHFRSPPRIENSVNNFGTIEEESFDRSLGDVPEKYRKDVDQTPEGLNVRYLLDQNNHLSAESTKLKHHLSVVSGDHEGLKFKYHKMEEEIHDKDREIVQLNGKVAALQMQIEAETDAKKEYARKLLLAESTIQSLQNQMSEFSKSDCLVRLQDNHDIMVRKLKENHENDMFALREKIEDLVLDLEGKRTQIKELERDLKLTKSQLSEQRSKSIRENSKSSPTTSKNTALFESLQSVKEELESAVAAKQELRNQNETLKKQVAEYKNQNSDLSSILKDKDSIINDLRSDARKTKIMNLDRNEQLKLNEQNLRLKEEVADGAKSIKHLERMLESARKEISELKAKNRELQHELEVSRTGKNHEDLFTQEEVQKMVEETTEEWRHNIEAKFEEQYMRSVKELEKCYEHSKEKIVNDTQNEMRRQFIQSVEILCSWIKGLVESELKPSNDALQDVLVPVQELWSQIEDSFKTHTDNLIKKRVEAQNAIKELEEAYVSTLKEPHPDRQSLYVELEEVTKKLDEQGEKLKKYKSMCKHLQMKNAKEVERLKTEFTELLKNKKEHFRLKEEKLRDKLIGQWNEKCRIIDQAFVEALEDVKNQSDDILKQTQRKSRDLLMVTAKAYHEAVVNKISTQAPSPVTSIGSLDDRIVSKNVYVY